jgi:uncharacterized Zn finger protein (UPF0148 family)
MDPEYVVTCCDEEYKIYLSKDGRFVCPECGHNHKLTVEHTPGYQERTAVQQETLIKLNDAPRQVAYPD